MKVLLCTSILIILNLNLMLSQDYTDISKYGSKDLRSVDLFGISDDGLKIAYSMTPKNSISTLWINDTLLATNRIKTVLDSHFELNKILYQTYNETGDKWAIYVNGERISSFYFDRILFSGFLTNEDFSSVLFLLKYQGTYQLWLNHSKISFDFDQIGGVQMNKDASKILFKGKQGKNRAIWINTEKITEDYKDINTVFTDSKFSDIFYCAQNKEGYSCYLNKERVTQVFDEVIPLYVELNEQCKYVKEFDAMISKENESEIVRYFKTGKMGYTDGALYLNSDAGSEQSENLSSEFSQKTRIIYIACKNKKWSIWLNDKKMSSDFPDKFIALKGIRDDWSEIAYVAGTSLYINDSCITPSRQALMVNDYVYLSPDFKEYTYVALENFTSIFYNTEIFKSKLAIFKNGQQVTSPYWVISYWSIDPNTKNIKYIAPDGIHFNEKNYPMPEKLYAAGGYKSIKKKCLYSMAKGDYFFTDDYAKIAYVYYPAATSSYQVIYPSLWVNGSQATPSYDKLFFAIDHFRQTGELIFTGLSSKSKEVIHGISNVNVEKYSDK
ncbi:MAG: hypothetical protein J7K53_02985 [Bacteroidales bacterium]|nr:hypothetical protein [Bacteroidales bacterium]